MDFYPSEEWSNSTPHYRQRLYFPLILDIFFTSIILLRLVLYSTIFLSQVQQLDIKPGHPHPVSLHCLYFRLLVEKELLFFTQIRKSLPILPLSFVYRLNISHGQSWTFSMFPSKNGHMAVLSPAQVRSASRWLKYRSVPWTRLQRRVATSKVSHLQWRN